MKHLITTLMLCLSLNGAVIAKGSTDTLFTDLSGQPQAIENFTGDGKWLVVMIWANDCGICNQEAPSYAQFHEQHKDRNARVLGLSLDGPSGKDAAQSFVDRHALPFPNLLGEPELVGLKYQMLTQESLRGTPTFLLYGPDGALRAAQAGAVSIDKVAAFIDKNS